MPVHIHTPTAITMQPSSDAASQAAYEGPDENAILDAHEAHLDSLADASYRTLEAALGALKAIIADAVECDLFVGSWRAQQRVFQAACNVAEFVPSQAH